MCSISDSEIADSDADSEDEEHQRPEVSFIHEFLAGKLEYCNDLGKKIAL